MLSGTKFTAIALVCMVTLTIFLIHPDLVEAGKKKNLKKLKKLAALALLMKSKKKIMIPLPLPLPVPIP